MHPVRLLVQTEASNELKTQPATKRRVQFNLTQTQILLVSAREDITPEEVEAIWYMKSDYTKMNSWVRITVKMIEHGVPEEDGYCYRGLEHRTKQRKVCLGRIVQRSISAVMKEQDRQMVEEFGGLNSELLAEAYRGVSIASQLEPYKNAKIDAHEAAIIHNTPCEEEPLTKLAHSSRVVRRNTLLFGAQDTLEFPKSSCLCNSKDSPTVQTKKEADMISDQSAAAPTPSCQYGERKGLFRSLTRRMRRQPPPKPAVLSRKATRRSSM
jgi:hypothetical protein